MVFCHDMGISIQLCKWCSEMLAKSCLQLDTAILSCMNIKAGIETMHSKHKASWTDSCEMPSPIRIASKHASRLSQTYLTYHKCHMICCCRDRGSFSSASIFHCGDRGSRHWDGWGGWEFWSWGMWRLRGRFESWGGWAHRHGSWGWRWGRRHSCLYPSWRDELLAWVSYRSALISACKTTCIALKHSSQSKDWYVCSLANFCCNFAVSTAAKDTSTEVKIKFSIDINWGPFFASQAL